MAGEVICESVVVKRGTTCSSRATVAGHGFSRLARLHEIETLRMTSPESGPHDVADRASAPAANAAPAAPGATAATAANAGIACVVFDFDGTLTDVEHHAPLYEAAFRDELAWRVGVSKSAFLAAWNIAAAHVNESPAELGWTFEGRVVAPASADPYLFANAVARLVLEGGTWGGIDARDDAGHANAIYEAYRAAYTRVPTRFRPEVVTVIDALVAKGVDIFVVTNAYVADVTAKLATLPFARPSALRIRGDARKFQIANATTPDARFDALPSEIHVDGLRRPIYLKRGRYFDILKTVFEEANVTPGAVLVCGDIFELDLALPSALGANVQLVTHARTLPHERAAVAKLARGGVGAGLLPVLERFRG